MAFGKAKAVGIVSSIFFHNDVSVSVNVIPTLGQFRRYLLNRCLVCRAIGNWPSRTS